MKIRSKSLLSFLLVCGVTLAACAEAPEAATSPAVQNNVPAVQSPDVPTQGADLPTQTAAVQAANTNTPALAADSGQGQALLQQRCSTCHDPNLVSQFQGTASEWQMVVEAMVSNGAQLNSSEEQVLVNYLAQTYHP